ncbi:MAG: glycerophosphodiester phosphodiesterase [Saprospiraceae bacterium]|nr:glycerophosphodiester phosphodiesterase [Saprospiraceae bacterium]MDW8229746.1 glycerophosphodiester phosphodiesterase [Saprospiraceae bacterium]
MTVPNLHFIGGHFAWLLLFFVACKSLENKPVTIPPGFDWQGHRGARGLAPENSVPGFLRALEFPQITTLELDLAVSKDRHLIVSHEPWFNADICRRPDGSRIPAAEAEKVFLYQLTAAEIRAYDCGSLRHPRFPEQTPQPAHKPTLREVVEAVRAAYPNRAVRWNIEIKSRPEWDGIRTPPIDTFARLVVEEIAALGLQSTCTVQSFDPRALRAVRALNPQLTLALLVENFLGPAKNLERLGFTPAIYSPYHALVKPSTVRFCRQKGMKLIPWTVNDTETMRRLIQIGVDGIITDYPNRTPQ